MLSFLQKRRSHNELTPRKHKTITEGLFALGLIASFVLINIRGKAGFVCLFFIAAGLIAGLIRLESVNSKYYKAALLVSVSWLVIILSLAIAGIINRYGSF